jgi:ParB family chromosome partitioning protein
MAGLGRGLGSLIPAKTNHNESAVSSPSDRVVAGLNNDREQVLKVDPAQIKPNPKQPRKQFAEANLEELMESFREHGIIQPLIVTRADDGYELIAGERRLRSAKNLGLKEVPVIVRRADEQKKLEWAIIENIQRANLNPLELAQSYKQLADEFNLTQEALAKRLGKARSSVANTLRIMSLPQEIQTAIGQGVITEGHAKVLLGLDSEVKQQLLFKKILANQLSVNEATQETRRTGGTKQARVVAGPNDRDKELALQRWFSSKVSIKRSKKGGTIVISFGDEEELGGILRKVE